MLVKDYHLEFCRPPNPEAIHLRGVAHFDENIEEILPYLNTVLRGHLYMREPPSLTIKYRAKLITFHPRDIAINILQDEEEAEEIVKAFSTITHPCKIIYRPDKPNSIEPFLYDISKAKRDLGWYPKYSFAEMLVDYKKEMESGRFDFLLEKRRRMMVQK